MQLPTGRHGWHGIAYRRLEHRAARSQLDRECGRNGRGAHPRPCRCVAACGSSRTERPVTPPHGRSVPCAGTSVVHGTADTGHCHSRAAGCCAARGSWCMKHGSGACGSAGRSRFHTLPPASDHPGSTGFPVTGSDCSCRRSRLADPFAAVRHGASGSWRRPAAGRSSSRVRVAESAAGRPSASRPCRPCSSDLCPAVNPCRRSMPDGANLAHGRLHSRCSPPASACRSGWSPACSSAPRWWNDRLRSASSSSGRRLSSAVDSRT
jgi:hypothetical protein